MFSSVDTIWVLLAAALVFFMHAGFAMLETGFTRAKNSGNVIMKTLMDLALGSLIFWIVGYGIMFGVSKNGFIGNLDFFAQKGFVGTIPSPVFLILQTVFCVTAATIVSGAMAERTKFLAYCIFSAVITGFIYPVAGHWIWGGGWLQNLGFHDFAGSTAVHMVGGVAALVGAKILGARIGKYDKNGKSKAIPGHSLTLGAIGVFILWFCWFGFNGGSTLSATGDKSLFTMGSVFLNTNLAAAAGATITMIITWIKYKKPDVSMTLNGALGGLVAITAGSDVVSPLGAVLIGCIASFVIVFGIEFVDKKLRIDDPVGAIGVHCLCGATGTLMVGLFATSGGLFYGGGFHTLGIQALGIVTVAAWVSISMTLFFTIIKKTVGLRVSPAEEISGLDIEEHGIENSYSDLTPLLNSVEYGVNANVKGSVALEDAVPVELRSSKAPTASDVKMTKIEIITKQSKFEALKIAMNNIGITGMTVTNVLGCGMQKGSTEFYRGVEVEINLLPKVCVEIVVCKVPVKTVIDTAKSVLYTGKIGDGKIFVYDVENVIRVSTNEEGYLALLDD